MKGKWKHCGTALFIGCIIGLFAFFYTGYKTTTIESASGIDNTTGNEKTPWGVQKGTHTDTITAEWSPDVDLGIRQHKDIAWGAYEENVPFSVVINDGKPNRLAYDVPARIKWKNYYGAGKNWEAPKFDGKIVTVKFKLQQCGLSSALLQYEIQ
jgi:hypothetical protein